MDEAFWDQRYRSAASVWSGKPNPQLVAEVADASPGSALDAGAGEGADAVWLAEQGWQVTAVDFSRVALQRGHSHAAARGAEVAQKIVWLHEDLTQWQPPVASYDLVSVQFLHLPPAQRRPIYRRLADAVRPGGLLLIVGHHPSDLETTARRPSDRDLLFTADELARELGGEWTVLVRDARPRAASDPNGAPITIHDSVILARRTG